MKKGHVAIGLAVVLLVAALLVALFAGYKAAGLPKRLGFTLGVCTHGNESSELYALEHGVRRFRTDISLSGSQEALLGMEHNMYNANYLGILDYETLPGGSSNKNWSLEEWNASVANAINAYPWISAWEIWNEPLVAQFQTGYMNGSAHNYYMLIKSAYTIIKAREPNATIVCFGGAPIADYPAMLWYAQVWNYGASKYCDAISIHAYQYAPALLSSEQLQAWKASIYAYENLTGKPIWITEFGMPSYSEELQGYTQSMQEAFFAQSLNLFNSMSFVKRAYWYDLWGLSDGAAGNNFGLLNLTDPNSSVTSKAWHAFLSAYSGGASN
ncbi:MAG: glycosyl hydrolase [Candidatus Micrarchaeia archaeon]